MVFSYIKKFFNQLLDYKYFRKILKELNPIQEIKGLKIVFNTIKVDPNTFGIEFFLGAILQKLGAQVFHIVDDGALEHWDIIQFKHLRYRSDPKKVNINPVCYNRIARYRYFLPVNLAKWTNLEVNLIPTSSILKSFNPAKMIMDDALIEKHVFSSLVRFFEVDNFYEKELPSEVYYKKFKLQCFKSAYVAEWILKNINPDIYITSHGFYSTWGPAYDTMKQQKINSKVIRVHGYSSPQDVILTNGNACHIFTKKEKQEIYKLKTTPWIKQKVEEFFVKRINFSGADTKFLFGTSAYEDNFFLDLKKKACTEDRKIFIAFPNVIWDANLKENHKLFKGIIEWLKETIKFISKTKNILIIRLHPSESTVMKGAYSLKNEFESLVNKTENVFLISSEEKINSYWLVREVMDIGLVYTGFLGMEMPYMRKLAVCPANSPFSGLGLFFEPKNKEEYFSVLSKPEIILNNWSFDNAYKSAIKVLYYYIYIFRWKHPALMRNNIGGEIETNFRNVSIEDLDYQNNSEFRRLINRILE